MYNSSKFISDLTNSYAWDTTISFIQKCTNQTKYSSQLRVSETFSVTGTNTMEIKDVQCNIFDMASNVWEWTTETARTPEYPCVVRGGRFKDETYTNFRSNDTISNYYSSLGFRSIIYINV